MTLMAICVRKRLGSVAITAAINYWIGKGVDRPRWLVCPHGMGWRPQGDADLLRCFAQSPFGSMSSSSVPPQAPLPGPPPPSAGSPGASSPTSSVLSADSYTSTPLPPRSAVPSARPSSLPADGTTLRDLGLFYRGARAAFSPMETSRAPRFLGDPCRHAPLSDPGGPLMPGHCNMRDVAFRQHPIT